jgi:hypothetical protein
MKHREGCPKLTVIADMEDCICQRIGAGELAFRIVGGAALLALYFYTAQFIPWKQ